MIRDDDSDSRRLPRVILDPGDTYDAVHRTWQGIPGIECTRGGVLYATWYTGGEEEGQDNHVVLVASRDGGSTWSRPEIVIDPPGEVRAFDPVLWIDPRDRLWLFWAQSHAWWDGRGGVWGICRDAPDATEPAWSAPHRIANGVMMNKPTVLSNGDWLFPTAVWRVAPSRHAEVKPHAGALEEMEGEAMSNVTASLDEGGTFSRRGGADVPERTFDEHMLIERHDGSLWMLVRTKYGIGQSTSTDGGKTWSPGTPSGIAGPDSRFFIRRLSSGRLLLLHHHGFTGRSHLTASLSEDDGATWKGHLLLDDRSNVAYPDACIGKDGRIHVIYDRDRTVHGEVLMASITEPEILTGALREPASFLRRVVSRTTSTNPSVNKLLNVGA